MKKLSFLAALLCASMMSFAIDSSEPTSEYCGEIMSSGNTEAAFTWETNDAGAVVITISETLGGADEATHFRGNVFGQHLRRRSRQAQLNTMRIDQSPRKTLPTRNILKFVFIGILFEQVAFLT